jgi:hypothetical protein
LSTLVANPDEAQEVRNRVSFINLGNEAKIKAETQFLSPLQEVRNRVSFLNLGNEPKVKAETRFLSPFDYF